MSELDDQPRPPPLDYYVPPRRTAREWFEVALALGILGGAVLIFLGLLLTRR